ncbi:MAG: carboxypeptidase regulatory-like domain-containing protein [Candidatus Levybacteria bacterium]|nr:carboxypeptidase regulatory-like domain-containing protein [Candidatus Levybacteria bacterium]
MPKRLLLLSFVAVFLLVFFTQVSHIQTLAQEVPLTAPITPPITPPITFFNLIGKVTYRHLGKLLFNVQRVIPAEDVIVKVEAFFDDEISFETMTDENGNYGLNVPPGLYKVKVSDEDDTFFVPPLRIVPIKNKQKHANFQGLLFP